MRNTVLSVVTSVVLLGSPAWAQSGPASVEQFADRCPGDLNGDGVVDSADLASMLGSFGICRGCSEDLNHDGYVDETDVKNLAAFWGRCDSEEDASTIVGRTRADVPDDPEIYEGDVTTNDAVPSDLEHATCEGDLDRDGQIDSTDLSMLLAKYGQCRGCEEDLTGDGVVDEKDVDIMLGIWGECQHEEQEPSHVLRSLAAIDENEIEDELPQQNEPEEVEPQCIGDLDGNGTVDSDDLAILLGRYGRCHDCEADLSGDGHVNQHDVNVLMRMWGDCAEETSLDAGSNSPGQTRSQIRG